MRNFGNPVRGCSNCIEINVKKYKTEISVLPPPISAMICATICKMKFDWSLSICDGILDVTPIISTFSNVDYDCYSASDQIINFQPDEKGTYDLKSVADILVNDFLLQQDMKIVAVTNQEGNNNIEFAIEILKNIKNITMILLRDENTKILCEFPLLSDAGYQNSNLDYLYDVTENNPIIISLELCNIRNSLNVTYKVIFPKIMPCSKNLEFPKTLNGNSSFDDTELIDLIPSIESKIINPWNDRKLFLEELQKLTSVLEFDAVDFSFVLIALRMKHNNMYTICTIEFRLSHLFPSQMPLVSLHDLQNSFSSPIETSSIKITKSFTPVRIARELLLLAGSVISHQAFGMDILE